MTLYQFSCVAPLGGLFLVGALVMAYMEWKGWF